MTIKSALSTALLCLLTANASAQWNPTPNWKDSYAVGGQCYCDTNGFDHGLDTKSANTPIGVLSVVQICADIKSKLGTGQAAGRIPYNDIQCGNGPANDANDESGCPGRVDIGASGCNIKGPKWNLEAVYGKWNTTSEPTDSSRVSTSASPQGKDSKLAVDNKANTRWTTKTPQRPGQVFMLDLGSAQLVGKVVLDTKQNPNDSPAGYSLSTSVDGKKYTVAATGSGKDSVTVINFENRSARYLRITQTGRKTKNWWSIHEIDVGTSSGNPVDNGGTKLNRSNWVMYASSRNADTANATDGNQSSRWATGTPQRNGQWFEIDLSSKKSFNKIELETDANPFDYPRQFTVKISNDGANWKKVSSGAGNNAVTTITFNQQTARYIRIEQSGYHAKRWWSIHEVNVFR